MHKIQWLSDQAPFSCCRSGLPRTITHTDRHHFAASRSYNSEGCRTLFASTTASAVMLTMRRTVALGVRI
jgi:hypothetical protein